MKRSALLLLFVLAVAAALHAQFWQKKPPQDWSKSDCQKMLSNSPWAKSQVVTQIMLARTTEPSEAPTAVTGGAIQTPGRDVQPEVRYEVRFLSATPVRQALVRQVQQSPQFQKLAPEQKKSAEEQQAGFINTLYPDHVVVQVSYTTNVGGQPILQPTDKKVAVEFVHPTVGLLRTQRIYVEFKVKDMMLDGQLVY